jgi:hypothetical protein
VFATTIICICSFINLSNKLNQLLAIIELIININSLCNQGFFFQILQVGVYWRESSTLISNKWQLS